MLQRPLIQTVDTNFMGLCPAAVQIDGHGNPTFLVNRLTFPAADPFAQRFYLAHELGHWLLATDNEQTADTFALSALAGTEHQSLKKSLAALNRLHTIPYSRLHALYQHCITIDNQHKHQPLISIIMKQNLSNDLNRKIFVNRADGDSLLLSAAAKTTTSAFYPLYLEQAVGTDRYALHTGTTASSYKFWDLDEDGALQTAASSTLQAFPFQLIAYDATGVGKIEAAATGLPRRSSVDLSGRPAPALPPQRGVYVVGGRKILIK